VRGIVIRPTVRTSEGRPRQALVRVALFWVAYFAILLLASVAKSAAPPRWGQIVWGLTSSIALVAVTLFMLQREGRSAEDVGLGVSRGTIARFLLGTLVGSFAYLFSVAAIAVLVGPIHFARVVGPSLSVMGFTVCSYLALSLMEEIGLRGYAQRTLDARFGLVRAMFATAGVTALSHLAFGWAWQTVIMGVVPGALLFGAAAIASRGLAMPIGLHAAVNIARWVAGETDSAGLWTFAIDEGVQGRVITWAPLIGLTAFSMVTAALLLWHVRHRPPVQVVPA
jgi:uncharacterized protein